MNARPNVPDDPATTLHIGHDELVIRHRYEVVSIVDDLLIGLWLLLGHALLFSAALETWGLVFLLVGSVLMMARGFIHLARLVHLRRFRIVPVGGMS